MVEKLWAGRFEANTNKAVEDFTNSLQDDCYLFEADIKASIAHLSALKKVELVSKKEESQIKECLEELLKKYLNGEFELKSEYEDIHMNIEAYLIDKLGDVGKKIHTGRSRNDQVVTAFKLTLITRVDNVLAKLLSLETVFIDLAEKYINIIIPGYTHLQKAQPILLSHYYMAYFEMFYRDIEKLMFYRQYLLELPLGSGALAGNPFSLDRKAVANDLGLVRPTHNSLDSISDRDYALDILYSLSLMMVHFSRLSEDVILWSTDEFGFITLSDAYTTGSSIMPQKKNPDVSELTRGKTGRVFGDLINLLTTTKALPMGYNRDLQEDKHAVFDALNTIDAVLEVNIGMLSTLSVNEGRVYKNVESGYLLATDLADYLVLKGMPFRDAHHVIGSLVKDAENKKKRLQDYSVHDLQSFSKLFTEEALKHLQLEYSVNARDSYGGTARKCVKSQIKLAKKRLKEVEDNG